MSVIHDWRPTRRAVLAGASAALAALPMAAEARNVPERLRGVQLYTVRTAFDADPIGTLQRVRRIGYRYVETAGLGGKTATELRKAIDGIGLKAVSSHVDPADWYTRLDAALDDVAKLGARYVVVPWTNEPERADWNRFADKLNSWAARAHAHGLRLAYHNHEFELAGAAGQRPLEVLLAHTDPALVDFELDVYWAAFAKVDPVAFIYAHADRIHLLHLKDGNAENLQRPVGSGVGDFRAILRAASAKKIAYAFVEMDDPADPFAEISQSRYFLYHL